MNSPHKRSIRWWPALVILCLAAGYWIWVWGFEDVQRQDKNLQTIGSALAAAFVLWLWLLFGSRLPWKTRVMLAGAALLVPVAVTALFEVRGVTGDFLPIFALRWSSKSRKPISALPPTHAETPRSSLTNDYPQILGPRRDGKVAGPVLARDWNATPPVQLWRHPVGAAWSGFAVAGRFAVTMEQRGADEHTTCYDLLSGSQLWTHADPAHYHTTIAGEGPRTVPAIANDSVYALGATGRLRALRLADGHLLWSKDILRDNDASSPDWGVSGSPLVFDNLVVVIAGGKQGRSLVAYNAPTGEPAWSGGDHRADHSSPLLATIGGLRQVLIFNTAGVSGHDAASGAELWNYPWRRGHPHIAMPLVLPGDRVFVSSGYGTGSELLQITQEPPGRWAARSLWKSNRLKSKFANLIALEDYVYGLDDGILVCLNLDNGELQWKEGRYGHGQMILVDKLLLIMAENGEIVLVEPVPQGPRELTRFKVFAEKTWNPPALAGPYLLVRNDKEAACYRLPTVRP